MSPRAEPPEREHADRGEYRLLWLRLLIYNLLLLVATPAIACYLLWRSLFRRRALGPWRDRLGLVPRVAGSGGPRIWLHAVSAGEVMAAQPVLEALRAALPSARIAMSSVTAAGMSLARRSCQADAFFYLPLDEPGCMGRALARLRPQLLVVTEKELWPNLLGLSRLSGVKVLVVNGRVSDRMMKRARWARGFVQWLYSLPNRFCVQSEQDARRLRRLGLPDHRVTVSGHTKVDSLAAPGSSPAERLASDLGISGDEVWVVAGSTHAGEEQAALAAFRRLRSAVPRARLLLAPRHLERVPAVAALVAAQGWPVARRSEGRPASPEAIVVLDTMGELRDAYRSAAVAFVGGTLVPVGGHNLLEPTAAGRAVLFGPHTENCSDVADLVVESGVGFRVRDADDLAQQLIRIAGDPRLRVDIAAAARVLIARQRGAARRCAEVACALLGQESAP